jgi:biofilm PGA synthesis N-glycosyltransferase PgaC
MKVLFWLSAATLGYTYAGYLVFLWARTCVRPRPVRRGPYLPSVSIVIAARNEALTLPAKLANLAELDYPAEKIEIVIVSDGSTDGTNEILREAGDRVRSVICEMPLGKAMALNQAVAIASGEIVVFTDARQALDENSVRNLAANFADPEIGCVSGELMLADKHSGSLGKGLGLYWRLEKLIRQLEAASGSVVGATGAIYAVRRELLSSVPPGTILDDVLIPMRVVKQHRRVVFESQSLAWDAISERRHHEFRRKVRTLLGNYQILLLEPWLLSWNNPLLFEYISHKLLRLLGPLMLIILLASSLSLGGSFYGSVFAFQIFFYSLAMLAFITPVQWKIRRITDGALTFLTLNAAAVVAFLYFISGKREVWNR